MESLMSCKTHLNSALVVLAGSGSCFVLAYVASYSLPLWINMMASPPSSTMRSGPSVSAQVSICSVHHQYSGSVSPFHAKTAAVPALAHAAAAWSCVLKMLQEHQRTLAPNAESVSISTAVWIVMWRDPEMLTPAKGCLKPYSLRHDMSPGISVSARSSSLRPNSARPISLTLESDGDHGAHGSGIGTPGSG